MKGKKEKMKNELKKLMKLRKQLYDRYWEECNDWEGEPEKAWAEVAYLDKVIARLQIENGAIPCLRIRVDIDEMEDEEIKALGIEKYGDCIDCVWNGNFYDYFDLTAGYQEYVLVNDKYYGTVEYMFASDENTDTWNKASWYEE